MILKIIFGVLLVIIIIEQYCRWHKKSALEMLHPEWFANATIFPYDDFPCNKNKNKYKQTIYNGYRKMKTIRVVIAGLCINIEKQIPKLRDRLKQLGSLFLDYKCVVFENDSKDGTREKLKDIDIIELVDCTENIECKLNRKSARDTGVMSENRMRHMADYRNRLLKYVRNKYSNYHCIIFIDFDIEGPISMDGIAHSFGLYDEWDSISAYGINGLALTLGRPIYYDYLAYDDGNYNINNNLLDAIPIFNKLRNKTIGDDPFKVISGFCGLAIYKMYVINNGVDYTPSDDKYPCEHVIFHKNMIVNGYDKIYINPNMILLSGVQGPYQKYPLY